MSASTLHGRGLAPVRTVLPNGAVVIAKETRKTPAATINLGVRLGSVCDPPDRPGLMHLLSKVIDRGTESRSASEIADALESRGVSLSVGVTRHTLILSCTCLAEHFRPVFELLADIVRHPVVPEHELTVRKGEVATALRQDADNPAVRAMEALMARLYGSNHPYGLPVKGTLELVESMEPSELRQLHRNWFSPAAISAVVVGDVPAAEVGAVVGAAFEDWRAPMPGARVVPAAAKATERHRLVIPMMNKAQTDIAYGLITMGRHDPDYHAFHLLNNVLGQYALGGRLGDSIRERQGMAYYVFSSFDPYIVPGPLVVRAGVSAANVERAVASIDEEVGALAREGPSPKEHAESTEYLIGSLPRALETNAGIAQFLQTSEFFGLGMDYDVRLPALLRGVSHDQIRAVAARYLDPGSAAVVIAGPYDEP